MKVVALILALVSGWTYACSQDGKTGFLPENNMYIPVGAKSPNGGLTQAQFNGVIAKIEKIYAPVIANLGARLVIDRLWTDGNVNAYAERDTPKLWTVQMFGGLARHEAITTDGFALVLCHEIGHHVGGAPKKKGVMTNPWSSTEGQSDYWASLKCLRQVFLNDNNAAVVKTLAAPADLVNACKKAFTKDDVNICIRSGMAGASVAALFASFDNTKASFSTPDLSVVSSTVDSHPATQCRLDTFFQGSLCTKSFNENVSQAEEVRGTCHQTLGDKVGLRPRCWHRPKTR